MRNKKRNESLINFTNNFNLSEAERNLTGISLFYLYFDINCETVVAAKRKDIGSEVLFLKKIHEKSFLYSKDGRKIEGVEGSFIFEDKYGYQGFLQEDYILCNYDVKDLSWSDKVILRLNFENDKKEYNVKKFINNKSINKKEFAF
jgi:hypothetical protein